MPRHAALGLALASLTLATPPMHAAAADLTTLSEHSGFIRTGRYAEVIALCDAFAKAYPESARCFDFGMTPEGRPMKALAVSTGGALTPQAAKAKQLPVVLVQGGIHAGEIDGKDAGFWLLRDLLADKRAHGVLDRQVMLFVPVFNIDGHENFRAWNRPNQRGPEEMGFRVTAQRFNLNRDYVKADTPEMRALLALVNDWDPLVEIDLHATDGAQFQHDISITAQPVNAGDAGLREVGRRLRDGLIADLALRGARPVDFYPSFIENDNPASGFSEGVPSARFSHGYYMLRNRIGILVETHSWRPYPERVRTTRDTLESLLTRVARHGRDWQAEARAADTRALALAGQSVPLAWSVLDTPKTIEFHGYAYTRTPSEISGALMTRYDESKPEVWKVPLRNQVTPAIETTAPRAGYLVPVAWASYVEPTLKVHGIEYRRIDTPLPGIAVETFHAREAKFAPNSVEGHQRIGLKGEWRADRRDLSTGALFVPITQPKARLVMQLLEPLAPDALVAWGAMNNAFEQKEYMEDYVAEAEARQMLANDPALKTEFERRLKDDPEFARSPEARLDFFYRRHPAYDRDLRRYPVLRTANEPVRR
ncbi:peptidase M14 [Lysobacter pythonis]|uniref:Peptidase M14 n=1 Tax=Solilutibacter pythonis TaxID=2483112 RepID=A0A3M2I313_9GAMM|nr:M14 family metallopeptidase [Lysobacter pythonis]RMH94533.1 peptidase M14 [Lysobacter pythonis]